jgi:signal transduction histidine kinase
MRTVAALRDLRARRPSAFELGAGIAAGALVLVVSVSQWGAGTDSLFRATSLAVWLGAVVWILARRRRVADERAHRALVAQRLELARELHDTVAGQVGAIGIQAAAARRVLDARPQEAALALERIEAMARTANADLRRMLVALRGDATATQANEPGLGDLDRFVETLPGGPANVRVSIEPGALPVGDAVVDRASYRIVTEALTNVLRHAGYVPVEVRVARDGGVLSLEVVNGPGPVSIPDARLGYSSASHDGGLGLVGIRERVAILGGVAETGPTRDGGYAVRARLPLRDVS